MKHIDCRGSIPAHSDAYAANRIFTLAEVLWRPFRHGACGQEKSIMGADRPKWDEERAAAMVGLCVLIGMTYVTFEETRHEQMYGTIISANAVTGFQIELEGTRKGEVIRLPPHLDAFRQLPPGEYEIVSTGEVVSNPDLMTSWTSTKGMIH